MSRSRHIFTALLLTFILIGDARAQHTLWNFLGIPQGCNKIHGAIWNRHGNLPGLEKKPPLRGLADPANLDPKMPPAVQKAAEVKQQEDLKKQKIKAIKYLTKIGCGCYDQDGSITEALVASATDCTEDVRLATVEAIADAAEGECCSNCGVNCCCKEPVLKQLAAMAYEKDDSGCPLEPSARVREAAARALEICCPSSGPVEVVEPIENGGSSFQPEVPAETPQPLPEPESAQRGTIRYVAPIQHATKGIPSTHSTAARAAPARPAVRGLLAGVLSPSKKRLSPSKKRQAQHNRHSVSRRRTTTSRPKVSRSIKTRGNGQQRHLTRVDESTHHTFGLVVNSTPKQGKAHVHFAQPKEKVPRGTMLTVYRPGDTGFDVIGQVSVDTGASGSTDVRAIKTLDTIKTGDLVAIPIARVAYRGTK